MPLYEFRCPECGARFEELVWSSNHEDVICPDCGHPQPVREMSTFASRGDSAGSRTSSASSSCCGPGGCSCG